MSVKGDFLLSGSATIDAALHLRSSYGMCVWKQIFDATSECAVRPRPQVMALKAEVADSRSHGRSKGGANSCHCELQVKRGSGGVTAIARRALAFRNLVCGWILLQQNLNLLNFESNPISKIPLVDADSTTQPRDVQERMVRAAGERVVTSGHVGLPSIVDGEIIMTSKGLCLCVW